MYYMSVSSQGSWQNGIKVNRHVREEFVTSPTISHIQLCPVGHVLKQDKTSTRNQILSLSKCTAELHVLFSNSYVRIDSSKSINRDFVELGFDIDRQL